jgi:hypothetical protein
MKLGFTGTGSKPGMDAWQQLQLINFIADNGVTELHHGDCEWADDQADHIAKTLGIKVVIHPPTDDKKRAYCYGKGSNGYRHNYENQELRPPKPYLERNHDIVDETDELFAAPKEQKEILRSGTWATVRYARDKVKKPVTIELRQI